MTHPLPRRERLSLTQAARNVLVGGDDLFHDFTGAAGEEQLRFLWDTFGAQLLKEHPADGTRPMGWWWWGAPARVRVDYRQVLLRTEQRQKLLAAGILNGAETETARQKIREFEESGRPMAWFDFGIPESR